MQSFSSTVLSHDERVEIIKAYNAMLQEGYCIRDNLYKSYYQGKKRCSVPGNVLAEIKVLEAPGANTMFNKLSDFVNSLLGRDKSEEMSWKDFLESDAAAEALKKKSDDQLESVFGQARIQADSIAKVCFLYLFFSDTVTTPREDGSTIEGFLLKKSKTWTVSYSKDLAKQKKGELEESESKSAEKVGALPTKTTKKRKRKKSSEEGPGKKAKSSLPPLLENDSKDDESIPAEVDDSFWSQLAKTTDDSFWLRLAQTPTDVVAYLISLGVQPAFLSGIFKPAIAPPLLMTPAPSESAMPGVLLPQPQKFLLSQNYAAFLAGPQPQQKPEGLGLGLGGSAFKRPG